VNTPLIRSERHHVRPWRAAGHVVLRVPAALWWIVRWSIFTALAILEPVVCAVLSGLTLLLVFVSVLFGLIGQAPNFPFLGMLGVAGACVLLLALYYVVMRLFMPR